MQTILGAGGAIGIELAKSLTYYTDKLRLVGRNPQKVNPTDEVFAADLSDAAQMRRALEGCQIAYLTVGLPYTTKIWAAQWPGLAKNVVEACLSQGCKLVFFDNVYAIGGDNVRHITESSPISPTSQKGHIRAQVEKIILDAAEKRGLQVIIARSPDFFGPVKLKSLTMNMVYDNLAKGKPAQWFCRGDMPHSTGYTPELAKGTAMLANRSDAYQQIWNLPVDTQAPTAKEWTQMFAHAMSKPDKLQVLPSWGIWLLGRFVPIVGEMYEMRYQYDRPYFFDSSKFNNAFGYTPITNEQAVKDTVAALA